MLFLSLLLPGPGHTPEFIPKGTEWPGAVTAANVHDSVAAPELVDRVVDEPGRERKPTGVDSEFDEQGEQVSGTWESAFAAGSRAEAGFHRFCP